MIFLTRSVMSSQLVSISEDREATEADELMKRHKIRHLPVVDIFNELAGIISSTDVANSHGKKNKIKDLMNPRVRVIKQDANVKKIIAQLLKYKISSMLVAQGEEIVGIVTTDDLLQLLYELLDEDDNLKKLEVSTLIENEWDGIDEDDLHDVQIQADAEYYS